MIPAEWVAAHVAAVGKAVRGIVPILKAAEAAAPDAPDVAAAAIGRAWGRRADAYACAFLNGPHPKVFMYANVNHEDSGAYVHGLRVAWRDEFRCAVARALARRPPRYPIMVTTDVGGSNVLLAHVTYVDALSAAQRAQVDAVLGPFMAAEVQHGDGVLQLQATVTARAGPGCQLLTCGDTTLFGFRCESAAAHSAYLRAVMPWTVTISAFWLPGGDATCRACVARFTYAGKQSLPIADDQWASAAMTFFQKENGWLPGEEAYASDVTLSRALGCFMAADTAPFAISDRDDALIARVTAAVAARASVDASDAARCADAEVAPFADTLRRSARWLALVSGGAYSPLRDADLTSSATVSAFHVAAMSASVAWPVRSAGYPRRAAAAALVV